MPRTLFLPEIGYQPTYQRKFCCNPVFDSTAAMSRSPPKDLARTFKTRWAGIFKKAAELHGIDERVRISIIVEKPGSTPLVFSTEEAGLAWPPLMQQYAETYRPIVKRPSHYQSLNEGISNGRVQVVQSSDRSQTPSPSPPSAAQLSSSPGKRANTPDVLSMGNGLKFDGQGEEMRRRTSSIAADDTWLIPSSPPRGTPNRTLSPLPSTILLPSKRRRLN